MIGVGPSTATAPPPPSAHAHEQDPLLTSVVSALPAAATATTTTMATTTTTTQCEQVPRALCTILPAQPPSSSPSPPPPVMRSETPEDVMLQDCLQALSTLKQGTSTPRMAPVEPATVGGIVPPVGVNAKKPRKMRTPRNTLASGDHTRTPSGSGRRRTVTNDDPSKPAAPVPVATTKSHRKSHSGGLCFVYSFVSIDAFALLCSFCVALVIISSVVSIFSFTEA